MKKYAKPTLEIISFDATDIVMASTTDSCPLDGLGGKHEDEVAKNNSVV